MTTTATIHMFLHPKGGIGKSTMASWFAQWRLQSDRPIEVIDTDDTSRSIRAFKSLPSQPWKVITDGQMDMDKIDDLWRKCVSTEHDLLLDTGSAATFTTLVKALTDGEVAEAIRESGRELIMHTLIAGGPQRLASLVAFDDLVATFPGTPFVLWKNPHGGEIEAEGKAFEETGAYKKNAAAVRAIVNVPTFPWNLQGKAVNKMLADWMCFDEVLGTTKDFLTRNRIRKAQRLLYDAITLGVA